jgi:hypothetical protein
VSGRDGHGPISDFPLPVKYRAPRFAPAMMLDQQIASLLAICIKKAGVANGHGGLEIVACGVLPSEHCTN